jgi:hypothetical protein
MKISSKQTIVVNDFIYFPFVGITVSRMTCEQSEAGLFASLDHCFIKYDYLNPPA